MKNTRVVLHLKRLLKIHSIFTKFKKKKKETKLTNRFTNIQHNHDFRLAVDLNLYLIT